LNGSFIALAGDPARSRWSALEIQRTRFRARLAVLSAGQTGLGGTHDAGVIGLARGFQISGVPRVVVSLWNVDDSATADLMQTFVQELAARPPADALRQAMLRTRRAFPEPLQWASFTLFGTPW
jgi:CHAT domain-containing protein